MVNFAGTALVAILAATASAEHRFGRRHLHPRSYVVAPPPAEYSTVPEASSSSSSSKSEYHTVPAPHPTYSHGHHGHPHPSGYSSVPTHESSSTTAPYGYTNTTVSHGPVGTGTGVYTTTPEVSLSTVTVVPIPETTPVNSETSKGEQPTGGNGYPTGEQPTGGNGYPTGGLPGTSAVPSEGETCGPETVTVTVTESTVYVTAGSSTVPEVESSSVKTYSTAPVESHPAPTYPASSEKPKTTPVASESETKPVYSSVPETTPVASESETKPVYSSHPETTPVASTSEYETKTSSTPKPSASSYPVSGKKRGIIYQETSDLSSFSDDSCGWAWNWNSNNFGMEGNWNYVPILNTPDKAAEFSEQVGKALDAAPEGQKYVMGLNEPDQQGGGGSGVDVGTAVSNYLEYIAPLADKGAKLGSISVTSDQSGALKGLTYLESWKKTCDEQGGCPVDFVCLHYYGNPAQDGDTQAEEFIEYMKTAISKVHELWSSDMPIWLTEVSAMPHIDEDSEGKNVAFIPKAVDYMENEPAIARYAYFMASPGYMIDASGALTPAGEAYVKAH